MRILRSHRVFATICSTTLSCVALFSPAAHAQEPPTTAPETPATKPDEAQNPDRPDGAERPEGRRGRQRRQTIVIEAGTVHPVAGPAIADGVVVIRGERIVAVGKKGTVPVPPNAVVRSFPTGHVYPGLIDALSDAYTDQEATRNGGFDGGCQFADDLHVRSDRSDNLVQAGITTAYIAVRSSAQVRGQGALVRPLHDGFELWPEHEHAALELRMTNGPGPSNPLQRQQELQAVDGLFEGLDDYRKAATDYQEALKKYDKEFADYLDWHEKKKGNPPAPTDNKEAPAAPPTTERPTRPGSNREGRTGRGGRGGGGGGGGGGEPPKQPGAAEIEQAIEALFGQDPPPTPKQEPAKQEPAKQEPAKQEPKPAEGQPAAEKKDEAPKRPTYPKKPASDPQKDVLLRVIDGELPLRVEAHRADELRAALRLMHEHSIPLLVLEQAFGAADLGPDLAAAGCSVVLTEVLPNSLPKPYDDFDPTSLPKQLQAAGVSFAIATGNARIADLLPLMAAAAVGRGLDAEAALRAITLTPAEILGVAKDTGSLQADKLADVLVCDRPLFQTDSHVLLVLAKGRTEFEVK